MAYIGTLYLFGIECTSSKTEWKQRFDVDNCDKWYNTIYNNHKGLYCGKSKSNGIYGKCKETITEWDTTYYNSNGEYCGKSISKMIKDTIQYRNWDTTYYDSNGILCGTAKSIDVIKDVIMEGLCHGWKTDYFDVNGDKCGRSISKMNIIGNHRSPGDRLTDHWITEYHNGNSDKYTNSESNGCGFLNWLKFW